MTDRGKRVFSKKPALPPLSTERESARTGKNVMFVGDGACRDMFISLHPEDIRAQLS